MPRIFNIEELELNIKDAPLAKYNWESSSDLAKLAGLSDFACNLRSLEKGQVSYPYHFHHNADEMFIIIAGTGLLRTEQGDSKVQAGDIILFEKGRNGAHQLTNTDDANLIYLDMRSLKDLDVCEYPDSGKVNILPAAEIFLRGADADYFQGEDGKAPRQSSGTTRPAAAAPSAGSAESAHSAALEEEIHPQMDGGHKNDSSDNDDSRITEIPL